MKEETLERFYNEVCNHYEESYRIILENNVKEEDKINKTWIEYDPVKWTIEPGIENYMNTFINNSSLSFEDKLLKIYEYICLNYVYDDNVLFFFKKRVDENGNKIYIPVDWYARIIGDDWIQKRSTHNKRVCYEFARFFAKAINKILDAENRTDLEACILGLNDNTHYIVGLTGDNYSASLDLDNFNRIKDLTRLKLGLTLQGITILRDDNKIISNAIDKYNENRPEDLAKVIEIDNLRKTDFVSYITKVVSILKEYKLDPQGFMEYIKQKLSDNEIDADKVWREIPNAKEKNYVRNLSFEYDGKKYIVDSIDQTIKETTDEEIEKNYITNPEEHEYTYYGG